MMKGLDDKSIAVEPEETGKEPISIDQKGTGAEPLQETGIEFGRVKSKSERLTEKTNL